MLSVEAGDVLTSRLHRRVIFTPATWLKPITEPRVLQRDLSEIEALLQAPLRGWKAGHHEGTGALLSREQYAPILRRLADDLLLAGSRAEVLVSPRPEQGSALYPDAIEVQTPEQLRDAIAAALELPIAPAPVRTPLGRDRLVVIYACARSGTTWLELLLNAHPGMGGRDTAETFVFHDLTRVWSRFGQSARSALRTYCDDVFGGASYFVEKTPLHTQCIELINAVYPDAWSVHLLRDGRDVARSLAEVSIFDRVGVDMDVRTGAQLWKSVVLSVRAAAPTLDRFRELRYETLVADPLAQAVELLKWVGLSCDHSVRAEIASRATREVSAHGSSGAAGPGKWHSLPAADLAAIYDEAGDLLVAEGYWTLTEIGPARGLLRRLLDRVIR